MTEPAAAEILLDQRDGLGLLTLNRPAAINALNHRMVEAITPALRAWADDDGVRGVVLTGAGERGLCAGGDIVAIYHDALAGGPSPDERRRNEQPSPAAESTDSARFWRAEYALNHLIARYPKPYVAVMDGIVMGGGVGLSAHGNVRIVTDRSKIGMPETGIGFVPDVGGTHLLARAPGELGTHVALTTARMDAGDAIAAGFADYYVRAERIPELLAALGDNPIEAAVVQFASPAPESGLAAQRVWIDECYSADTVEEIVARLLDHRDPAATQAARQILGNSPTALKVTLRSLRQAAASASLAQTLNEEYRVSLACLRSHDLAEGIRAQVIDKDRNPRWSPATLGDVTDGQVGAFFAGLGDHELGLKDGDR